MHRSSFLRMEYLVKYYEEFMGGGVKRFLI